MFTAAHGHPGHKTESHEFAARGFFIVEATVSEQNNKPTEGFITPDGRTVFSLIYTLEAPKSLQIIVPLGSDGNSMNGLTRAADYSKRVVDVRPGEELRFQSKRYKVVKVEPYRWVQDGRTHGWPSDAR